MRSDLRAVALSLVASGMFFLFVSLTGESRAAVALGTLLVVLAVVASWHWRPRRLRVSRDRAVRVLFEVFLSLIAAYSSWFHILPFFMRLEDEYRLPWWPVNYISACVTTAAHGEACQPSSELSRDGWVVLVVSTAMATLLTGLVTERLTED